MITHHQKEGIGINELARLQNRMTVSLRFALLDQGHFFKVAGNGGGEVALGSGGNDDGSRLDSAGENLIEKETSHRLGFAGRVHQGLQREVFLVRAGGGDDRFLNLHGSKARVAGMERNDKREGDPDLDTKGASGHGRGDKS